MRNDPKRASAGTSGKHKTVIQFTAILLILVYLIVRETAFWQPQWDDIAHPIVHWFMAFVVGFTIYSGYVYLWLNRQYLTEHPPK